MDAAARAALVASLNSFITSVQNSTGTVASDTPDIKISAIAALTANVVSKKAAADQALARLTTLTASILASDLEHETAVAQLAAITAAFNASTGSGGSSGGGGTPPPPVGNEDVGTPPAPATPTSTVTSLAALRTLVSGSVTRLQAGTYSGVLDMRNVSFAAPTTIIADGCTVNNYVLLGNTNNLTIDGLAIRPTTYRAIDLDVGCANIVFRRLDIRGTVLNPLTVHGDAYANVDGIVSPQIQGPLTIEDCLIEHVNNGFFADVSGDINFNRNTIRYCGGDGMKVALNSVNGVKNFIGNTIAYPMAGLTAEHPDAIQFTAIGISSTTDYNNLVFKWNVAYENPAISAGVHQGFVSFSDGSALGRRFNNAVVQNNYVVTSMGNGLVFFNVKDGSFTNNTAVGVNMNQQNTPFISIGGLSKIGTVIEAGNLAPAKDTYPTMFIWNGTDGMTSRADVLAKLTRR